jgi:hypothetical protein
MRLMNFPRASGPDAVAQREMPEPKAVLLAMGGGRGA